MIIINNEDALRVKCEDVISEEIPELVELLEKELKNSARLGRPGIGLAAPQIGIAKKIAIIRLNDLKLNLINSKIDKGFDQAVFRDEGCLSFPGRVEDTLRYQEIYVINNLAYPHSFIASGLLAIACQHELDHLNGILLSDRAIEKIIKKSKVRPNDSCHCGSNKKYKKCCMK